MPKNRYVLSLDQADKLVRELNRAMEEAKDHEMTMSACLHEIDLCIHINPHIKNDDPELET